MGLFLQKQDFVFCKGEGLVVTFSGNRNTLMDCHIGFKGMVACRLYNGYDVKDTTNTPSAIVDTAIAKGL